jgi:uncharacterized beta-barrel protein YwiB (DUF1934 family)
MIKVIGTQRDDTGEENRIELVSVGRHYQKNGIEYIVYAETAISGFEGTTTLVKLYPDHVAVVRMGSVEHKQEFRLNETSHSTYVTAFGTIKMSIFTKQLAVDFANSTGSIDVDYELAINGQWQSSNTLAITIWEDNINGHQATTY